ncbi:conjugal transfer protein TraX, partial [Bacteroides finegoldii]
YNGTRGFIHGQVVKYGFYAFYPVHLLLIQLLKSLFLYLYC